MSVKQQVWNYFISKGFTPQGIAGIMGNMQHESGFAPNNVENRWNTSTGMSDAQYTQMVDNGTYTNFVNDSYGYGLPQYTYFSYKQQLLDMSKERKVSIADVNTQLDLLCDCMQEVNIYNDIKTATNITTASNLFLLKFERPTDQSASVQNARASTSKAIYDEMTKTTASVTMKYNEMNQPLVCMQTNSTCYKNTTTMNIKGVLWHSTGANNNTLKRYVQPSNDDPNRDKLLALLGKNLYNNDWNHIEMQAGLNAWIGILENGEVTTIQTMPWNYKPWGCGSGSKGSCNDGWIQFEICEDNLNNKEYFDKIYEEACQLTAYLCKKYNLNPQGSASINGTIAPVILCHQDSFQLGLGSNHSDIYHWFTKYGKTMSNIRADVMKILSSAPAAQQTPVSIPTIQKPVATAKPIIKKGMVGALVKALQTNLIALGFLCGPDGADGDFGNNTEHAVIEFQQAHNIEVDGIVGEETYNAIEQAIQTSVQPATPSNSGDEIYRVRLSWDNIASQVGAYKVLANAINMAKQSGSNYKVYNSAGQLVYSAEKGTIIPEPVPTPTPSPTPHYVGVKLGSSSKDEYDSYHNGQAGDQTGEEVWIQDWYPGWNYVIRAKDATVAERMARECENACNNNNIGYDQNQRNSLYTEAKKVGLDLSKIITPCECDCSSLVSICCICAGMPESIFYAGGNMRTTYSLRQACEATGQYDILTASMYTNSKEYLKRGDILLNDGHTVIVLSNGSAVTSTVNVQQPNAPKTDTFTPYLVIITPNHLKVHSQPSIDSSVTTIVNKNEIFTIIDEKGGWGKLKSGAGWINLIYTQKYTKNV